MERCRNCLNRVFDIQTGDSYCIHCENTDTENQLKIINCNNFKQAFIEVNEQIKLVKLIVNEEVEVSPW